MADNIRYCLHDASETLTPRRALTAERSRCPISLALELFGDPWSLLVIRDLMFKGLRTFKEFQAAGEHIATNILSDRLARLEAAGVITRAPDPDDARRVRYGLSPKGAALAPILVEMVIWSAEYNDTDAPAEIVTHFKKNRRQVVAKIRTEWRARR